MTMPASALFASFELFTFHSQINDRIVRIRVTGNEVLILFSLFTMISILFFTLYYLVFLDPVDDEFLTSGELRPLCFEASKSDFSSLTISGHL